MPLLTNTNACHTNLKEARDFLVPGKRAQLSQIARAAIMSKGGSPLEGQDEARTLHPASHISLGQIDLTDNQTGRFATIKSPFRPQLGRNGYGAALNDTPETTAPNSPNIPPLTQRQNSAEKINRPRPTTLDIPGLTKSSVSPDGRIAQRDVGSKLVIVMVGLPARGKSYITKKMARYLNWLQHDTRIFNVGERRRVAAGGPLPPPNAEHTDQQNLADAMNMACLGDPHIFINGEALKDSTFSSSGRDNGNIRGRFDQINLPEPARGSMFDENPPSDHGIDQSASFFDPSNTKAALIREKCALDTLDELLDYILLHGGSVGILDATNSTLERRQSIMTHIRNRAGPDLNVLFLESICMDEQLLERNMGLKLSGPDYRGKNAQASLEDFKRRVSNYEKSYVPLGDWEEKNHMPYIQMIDVGRKVISHQIKGFLSAQAVYYLLNFNLAPRQIWLTRHGESFDNINGKIGGDAHLSPLGITYAQVLTKFVKYESKAWEIHEQEKKQNVRLPPYPGDTTPPNPHFGGGDDNHTSHKSFCIWTSMLKRSVNSAKYFDEDEFDIKQMKMLDELNGGTMEGLTYDEIRTQHRAQYELRRADKLSYRYPGPGGESYLDVINRLRPVIVELERMTDHCLLISHRAIMRVLLAYFKGLQREEVANLDVPLGTLYCLEPKPYGVDFKVFRFNKETEWFDLDPDYRLQRAVSRTEDE